MKKVIISVYIALFFCCFQMLKAQKNNQIWSHTVFDYAITFNFEKELKSIDTLKTVEGHIYYFRLFNDSCYFRFNYLTPEARFGCCEDSGYIEINRNNKFGIIDKNGKIKQSNLFWRKVQNKDIEIVYDYCPQGKIDFCNKVIDCILQSLAKDNSSEVDKKIIKKKKKQRGK
jgi:hypothetical protein